MIVGERKSVVIVLGLMDEDSNDIVGKLGKEGGVCEVLEGKLRTRSVNATRQECARHGMRGGGARYIVGDPAARAPS